MEIYLQIIANLIAFIAFLAFADSIVKYIFYLVGLNEVGIQFILGRLFIPCSWALGVRWEDCEAVGYVIGTKTFVNEFVAFKLLGEYSAAGKISVNWKILVKEILHQWRQMWILNFDLN